MDYLRQMSAMIAGGMVSVRGHDEPAATAKRSIEIAMEIDQQVGEMERSSPAPSGPPSDEPVHVADPAAA